MNQSEFFAEPQSGVPRSFAVSEMLLITAVFCVLVRAALAFEDPVASLSVVAANLVVIGIAQLILFRGNYPREASMLVGFVLWLFLGWLLASHAWTSPWEMAILIPAIGLLGIPIGYIFGLALGGISMGIKRASKLGSPELLRRPPEADKPLSRLELAIINLVRTSTLPFRPHRPVLELAGMTVWFLIAITPFLIESLGWRLGIRLPLWTTVLAIPVGVAWSGGRRLPYGFVLFDLLAGLIGGLIVGWCLSSVTLIPGKDFIPQLKVIVGGFAGAFAGLVVAGIIGWAREGPLFRPRMHRFMFWMGIVTPIAISIVLSIWIVTLSRGPRELALRSMPSSARVDSYDWPWVQRVDLGKAGTEKHVAMLPAFDRLIRCDLRWTSVTDNGIAPLLKLDLLQALWLGHTQVTDEGLRSVVSKMTQLQYLHLDHAAVSERGLAALKNLKELRTLSLRGCDLEGASLQLLAENHDLTFLDLGQTTVDGGAIQWVAKLSNLLNLSLAETTVRSADIAPLANLTELRILDLTGTRLDDSVVPTLLKLASTSRGVNIKLKESGLSDEALASLRKNAVNFEH